MSDLNNSEKQAQGVRLTVVVSSKAEIQEIQVRVGL